jgi:hypothetical protein
MTTQTEHDFQVISDVLLAIMRKNVGDTLQTRSMKPNHYEFYGPPNALTHGKDMWFGAVRIGKRYVSYHLMPVYVFPDMLREMSPELRKRMQGKSCFNFTHVDEQMFEELDKLTKLGYERFKQAGLFG